MRYIIAVELGDCFRAIARVSSFQTAKLLQFAIEQIYELKIVVVDTRGL